MRKTKRGFNHIVGVTVTEVDACAINEVVLKGDDGFEYVLEADIITWPFAIPVISLKKRRTGEG
jgi:hypothetical protein